MLHQVSKSSPKYAKFIAFPLNNMLDFLITNTIHTHGSSRGRYMLCSFWVQVRSVEWLNHCSSVCNKAVYRTLLKGHTWWRHHMETFSASLPICAGNSPVTGEFPAQRPVTRRIDVFFDLRLNKQFSKQSWGWWLVAPSRSLRLYCNENLNILERNTFIRWCGSITAIMGMKFALFAFLQSEWTLE